MFNLLKRKLKIVTHSGSFHADEVFACAVLSIWADKNNFKLDIKRSRKKEDIMKADIVVDVGGIYDPSILRFDHHQIGGAGTRPNGIPYASFGLVWQKYGEEICGSDDVAKFLEQKIVLSMDARDNGVNVTKSNPLGVDDYRVGNAISVFNPTNKEDGVSSDQRFGIALNFAKEILKRQILWAIAETEGEKETQKIIKEQNDPEILVIEEDIEWKRAVTKNSKIKFVVYYSGSSKEWKVQSARDDFEDFDSDRVNMPKSWWGLRDNELVEKTGVKDAIFCANSGWLAVAKSREGAIELANKALQINQN